MLILDAERRLAFLNRRRLLEGALSFKAPKLLEKEYSQAFSKLTMGFEAEIAITDQEEVSDETLLEDALRQFEADFSFTETEYLQSIGVKSLIANYDIKPIYGFADTKEIIQKILNENADAFAFKVIKGPDGKFAFPKGIRDWDFAVPEYVTEYSTWVQEDLVESYTNRAFEVTKDYVAKQELPQSSFIVNTLDQLEQYRNLYKRYDWNGVEVDAVDVDDDDHKYSALVAQGKHRANARIKAQNLSRIADCIKAIAQNLVNTMTDDYSESAVWHVLDEAGNTHTVEINKWKKTGAIGTGGLNSPLIDFDLDKFEEDYGQAREEEYNQERESFIADWEPPETDDDVKTISVNRLHNEVVRSVDRSAVNAGAYHTNESDRGETTLVEADGSIEPAGAEVVSEVFYDYNKAFTWLDDVFDMIENNDSWLETNTSTGLHVNIGTFHTIQPDFKMTDKNQMDLVKLAIFSGDSYLLSTFNRENNKFALEFGDLFSELLDKSEAKSSLNYLASSSELTEAIYLMNKTFISRMGDKRYRSINIGTLPAKNYVEFRIAGGRDYHADRDKIKKTVYRFMQLCVVATDPKAYLRDYLVALYKIISPNLPKEKAINPRPAKNAQEALEIVKAWIMDAPEVGGSNLLGFRPLRLHLQDTETMPPLNDENIVTNDGFFRFLFYLRLITGPMARRMPASVLYAMRMVLLRLISPDKLKAHGILADWFNNRGGDREFGRSGLSVRQLSYLFQGFPNLKEFN